MIENTQIIEMIENIQSFGNSDDQGIAYSNTTYSNDGQDQRDKQTVCINTAVNHTGAGFVSVPSIPN